MPEDPELDALIATYRVRIAEAARHNASVADALVAELGTILAARMMVERHTPLAAPATPPSSRYSMPWKGSR